LLTAPFSSALADRVHPALFAKEPEDIHLVRSLP
jgi:hypothetical protein